MQTKSILTAKPAFNKNDMEQEILKKITEQEQKIEEILRSVKKMRKYFLWTLIVTAVVIILPLIGLLLVIPSFINMYSGGTGF